VVVRQRRTLGLYVLDGGDVELRLPRNCPTQVGEDFVRSRREWLERTLAGRGRASGLPEADYRDGAPVQLLGRSLRLTLRVGAAAAVTRDDGQVLVRLPSPRPSAVYDALLAWYRHEALRLLPALVAQWYPRLALPGAAPSLRLRRMRARWGSCSSLGKLNLNLWLVRAPAACIDYVVVHELCHLREFNHGPAFHALVGSILPDWRERRAALVEHQRSHGVAPRDP
jgi:predicted metal-dependent hydrolase